MNDSRFGTNWNRDGFNGEIAFRTMRLAFADVMAKYRDQLWESHYVFGGRRVRMRVVGRELAQHMDRPFSHLQISGRAAAVGLTIDLWDHRLYGGERLVTRGDNGDGWHERTLESSDGRFMGQRLPNTFSCFDRKDNRIVGSIGWHDRIFIYERAKPLSRLLLAWHNDQDVQVIHTGLVARDRKGLLLVGKSGSGKSTSSLACVMAGFHYLSEDYVGLEIRGDGSCLGHSLYNSVFLKTDHLERFPELAPHAIRGRLPHEEKSVIILSQLFPEQLERAVTIRALVLPRVVTATTAKVRPASKGEALLALGPSSMLQIPNRVLGRNGFNKLAHLVERTPCFWLEVGSDLRSIPRRLGKLLVELGSQNCAR